MTFSLWEVVIAGFLTIDVGFVVGCWRVGRKAEWWEKKARHAADLAETALERGKGWRTRSDEWEQRATAWQEQAEGWERAARTNLDINIALNKKLLESQSEAPDTDERFDWLKGIGVP